MEEVLLALRSLMGAGLVRGVEQPAKAKPTANVIASGAAEAKARFTSIANRGLTINRFISPLIVKAQKRPRLVQFFDSVAS